MKNPLVIIGKMILVGAIHAIGLIGLYFTRIKHLLPVIDSDFVIIYVPSLFAFGAYGYVLWHDVFSTFHLALKILITPLVAIVAVILSFSIFGLVAFNIWGT